MPTTTPTVRRDAVDVDGTTASFLTAGDGPLVLLLHGTYWSRVWQPVIAPLAAAGLQPVAVDLPGCGRSGGELTRGHRDRAGADGVGRAVPRRARRAGPAPGRGPRHRRRDRPAAHGPRRPRGRAARARQRGHVRLVAGAGRRPLPRSRGRRRDDRGRAGRGAAHRADRRDRPPDRGGGAARLPQPVDRDARRALLDGARRRRRPALHARAGRRPGVRRRADAAAVGRGRHVPARGVRRALRRRDPRRDAAAAARLRPYSDGERAARRRGRARRMVRDEPRDRVPRRATRDGQAAALDARRSRERRRHLPGDVPARLVPRAA